jgi:hypothetical protein
MKEFFGLRISSVADSDPNPYPSDPYVFGLLDPDPDPLVRGIQPRIGSGSTPKCHRSATLRISLRFGVRIRQKKT